jgi:D-alanine-D-alanine ligase
MKICVLQPDYSPSDVDYGNYDPPRNLTALLPGHLVDYVSVNKLTTFRQLKQLSTQGYDIFVNLCEGYPEWDVPGIDVVDSLERLNLPFTGPSSALYDVHKALMKYVAYAEGVRTPAHVLVTDAQPLDIGTNGLRYPLFVKPAHAGDSLGIDAKSLVHDAAALDAQVAAMRREYGDVLVEEYIAGRELTVLVLANPEENGIATALTPVEYLFPPGLAFKTYANKTSDLHPEANVPLRDEALAARAKDAAVRMFRGFGGVGYARMDFRVDAEENLFFLEVNFTCSVFYADGFEGSADYILKFDPMGQAGFAAHIIAEGIARHRRAQKLFVVRGNAVAGYGIFATTGLAAGELVFRGEGRAHRIVTARHVKATWSADDQLTFRRYSYPLSGEVFAIWDNDPEAWAPQNHSCEANTAFDGLNIVALRAIRTGEELTLDYAGFMDGVSEPFACHCGTPSCRGTVTGTPGNSVSAREQGRARAP